jgi:mannose-6-phosphate isomerase-like protein (cupin superfamily)
VKLLTKLGHFPIFGKKILVWNNQHSEVFGGFILGVREFSWMASFYEIDSILSNLEKEEYFVDFLNTKSLEAGIIRLKKDQKDTQTNHPLDELYYVVKGDGYIRMGGKSQPVNQGTIIFVPAEIDHNFYGNREDLVVLYIFSKHKMVATSKD